MDDLRHPAPTDATRTTRQVGLRLRRPGRLVLRVASPTGTEERVVLERKRLVVGRSRAADITLDHPSVSGRHFELRPGRTTKIRDLGSKNGTWVNAREVFHGTLLAGDVVRAGDCTLHLERVEDLEVDLLADDCFGEMFGASTVMREVFADLARLAASELSVLITGETGTGKELAARAVHAHSTRRTGPFVVVDCATLPRGLAESMLFGHRRGAFTGADADHRGYFEQADRGTVFLDEIGELPLDLQPKLLRALDRREVVRLGEAVHRPVDVRIVAATHRDLLELVERGEFREDLYFRLCQSAAELPPLRERGEDVELLALRMLRGIEGRQEATLADDAMQALGGHPWPGNVRELRNVITRAASLVDSAVISRGDLALRQQTQRTGRIENALRAGSYEAVHDEIDRALLPRILDDHGGNLSKAAAELSVSRKRLRERLRRLGLYVARA